MINLQSNDGEVFKADAKIAQLAGTIKIVMEDCGITGGDDTVVPLPNVSGNILKRFIAWAEHHKDDAERSGEAKIDEEISAWDAEFLDVDQGTLFELILAANFLDAKDLLDVTCKTVANMIKGKTAEQIRQQFNIKNDFTEAEEAVVAKENDWCQKEYE